MSARKIRDKNEPAVFRSPVKPNSGIGYRLGLLILLAVTLILYINVREFSFLNYDDRRNIVNNTDIHDCSAAGLKKIFLAPQYPDEMAPPLTIYSFALNYHFSELDAEPYHLVNLFLHLINIILVFALITCVSGNQAAALFTATVFAIHPSLSEAVAWVTARKDLLYTFFYLLALFATFRFWSSRKIIFYLLAVILFILSYYSKYAAASFPLLYLILALLWKNRKDYMKVFAETLPFLVLPLYSLALSLIPGWKALAFVQQLQDRILDSSGIAKVQYSHIPPANLNNTFTLAQKFVLAGYSLVQYLLKFLFPFEQQVIYPYPVLKDGATFPLVYYFYAAIACCLLSLIIFVFYKKRKAFQSPIGFGAILFLIPALLLLHILPIGGRVVIADRYLYLPIIGLAVMLFFGLRWLSLRFSHRGILYVPIGVYIVVMAVNLHQRLPEWRDSEAIFSDLLEKEPQYFFGYVNLGAHYVDKQQYKEAETLFNRANELDTTIFVTYYNLGLVQIQTNDLENAKRNMERARALDTANFSVYYHLGEIYMKLGFTSEAFNMLQKSIELNGHYTPSRTNIGMVLVRLNRHDEAKMHLMKALELNPEIGAAHDALGMSYLELKNPEQALSHFSSAAALEPGNYMFLLHKCIALTQLNLFEESLKVSEILVKMNPNDGLSYYYRGLALQGITGGIRAGCSDIMKAHSMGIQGINPEMIVICQ